MRPESKMTIGGESKQRDYISMEQYNPPRQDSLGFEMPEGQGTVNPHGTAALDTGEIIGEDQEGEEVRRFNVHVSDRGADIKIYEHLVSETGEVSRRLVGAKIDGGKISKIRKGHEYLFELGEKLKAILRAVSSPPGDKGTNVSAYTGARIYRIKTNIT